MNSYARRSEACCRRQDIDGARLLRQLSHFLEQPALPVHLRLPD